MSRKSPVGLTVCCSQFFSRRLLKTLQTKIVVEKNDPDDINLC